MLLKYSNHNDILHTLGLIEIQLKIFRKVSINTISALQYLLFYNTLHIIVYTCENPINLNFHS